MKFKLQAGAEVDILSEPEMRSIFTDWMVELRRGVKFRKAGGQTNLGAGGVFTIGDPAHGHDAMGPQPGFVWAITNVALAGNGFTQGTDLATIFNGAASTLTVVASGISRQIAFNPGSFVVNPGDWVTVTGVGTGPAGSDVGVTLLVAEVPVQLAYQLL